MKSKSLFLKIILLALTFNIVGVSAAFSQARPFITVWKTDNIKDNRDTEKNEVEIPLSGTYDYQWEEVSNPSNNRTGKGEDFLFIKFPSPGIYRVRVTPSGIKPVNLMSYGLENARDNAKLVKLEQWGSMKWSSLFSAFLWTVNLDITATDVPDLSNVKNASSAFMNSGIDSVPNMDKWNTSNFTVMSNMFRNAASFNEFIGSWNVGNVKNMAYMFSGAKSFNQDIGFWDVRNVTNMEFMFDDIESFNYDIGKWDVGNVTKMFAMFQNSKSFNQDIGKWDVSNVTNMSYMFRGAEAFNQNLDSWNTENVTDMSSMFMGASSFAGDISNWNTSNVTDMSFMFSGVILFNTDIGDWDVGNTIDLSYMFNGAKSFNQDIGNWNTYNVTNMSGMFSDATLFNHDISGWDVSNVTDMSNMFSEAEAFNIDITGWDINNVINMGGMFSGAISFNHEIGRWDISNVQDISFILHNARSFSHSLENWNLKSLEPYSNIGLDFTAINCVDFSRTLRSWANHPDTPYDIELTAMDLTFSTEIYTEYNFLKNRLKWQIWGAESDDCTLGSRKQEFQSIVAYPNPTDGRFMLQGITDQSIIRLRDVTGRLVDHKVGKNGQDFDLGNYPAGIYFLEIMGSNRTLNGLKIVKL